MTDAKGGFYSAEDADSEGEEGKFYVWTKEEILEVLGEEDGELFSKAYGVRDEGNYLEEATRVRTGSNILHLAAPLAETAADVGMTTEELGTKLAPMREKLFDAREKRIHPHKDDKILADWNGLMISSLALAARILDEPRYEEAAVRAAGFLLGEMQRDGRLLHRYRDGDAGIPAFLDDYAFVALGLLDLYETTFDERWLEECDRLVEEMMRLFRDPQGGARGFFFTAPEADDLIKRTMEIYDGAIPSGNSVAALVLVRLGRLTANPEPENAARGILEHFSGQIARMPTAFPFALQALDFLVGPSREIVLAGERDDPGMQSMLRALRTRFLPNQVVAFRPEGGAAKRIEALAPFVASHGAVEGKATAYVCENHACRLPVTSVEDLVRVLEGGSPEAG
jgi:hypothetical protein